MQRRERQADCEALPPMSTPTRGRSLALAAIIAGAISLAWPWLLHGEAESLPATLARMAFTFVAIVFVTDVIPRWRRRRNTQR